MYRNVPRQRGFTLVELLVVIFIIGLLAALLIPAIVGAIARAQDAHMAFEIGGLKQAVDAYKNAKGDYPPNFSEGNYSTAAATNSYVRKHLQVAYSKLNPAHMVIGNNFFNANFAGDGTSAATSIDEAEALVFWLSYTVDDVREPFVFAKSGTDFNFAGVGKQRKIYFEFDERRLEDYDGDGFYAYQPKYAKGTHYVYFDSRSYGAANASAPNVLYNASTGATAMPYFKANNPNQPVEAIAKDSFQIICAGRDGDFGAIPPASGSNQPHKDWTFAKGLNPVNSYYAPGSGEMDNITSFSDSKLLRDLLP